MKRSVLTVIIACGMAFGAALFGTVAHADTQSDVQNGFDVAPVQLTLQGLNKSLVGKGSYIVNAQGGCNDCHTNPPYVGNPFAGDPIVINTDKYLAGGVNFGPGVFSRNLTPNADGLPAGLRLDQFIDAIRLGKDPKSGKILQVMPWPVYRHMNDKDLEAVYEYLRAIPCVVGPGHPC